ncbi:galactokinase [Rhizohabitans arisaemae]|uniref:galactokinase n=1 Tax=Rhizohabitans arisaemae TaxID=2720610 RepID=UPI0024B1462D|nr:galactokinase [Rhizohabitans arisaemae]
MTPIEAFQQGYGTAPAGVWHAPGRVNLIGEHTDYNGGLVLPIALPLGVDAAVAPREDGVLRVRSLQEPGPPVTIARPEPGTVTGWAAYPAGVVWALRAAGHRVGGADVLVDGDLPRGAGLASSAALEVAVGTALNDLYDLRLTPMEIAGICRRAENDFVGVPCGIMDQAVSALAVEGHALMLDCGSLASRAVRFDPGAAGMELLVVETGVRRELGDGRYRERRRECAEAARLLGVDALCEVTDVADALGRLGGEPVLRRRAQHVIIENHRVNSFLGLLRAKAVPELGGLLVASHLSLRDQFEVSCPELDVAVEAAVRGGARGGRMTGAGFGGSAIALVPVDRVPRVAEEVERAYAERGWKPPRIFPVRPAAGARRVG